MNFLTNFDLIEKCLKSGQSMSHIRKCAKKF